MSADRTPTPIVRRPRLPTRLIRAALLLALLLVTSTSLRAQPPEPGAADTANTAAVTIAGFAYSPEQLTIPLGTTVTWTNNDAAPHDVVSYDRFSIVSDLMETGESFAQRFDEPGSFAYFCTLHPSMQAVVVVEPPTGPLPVFLPLLAASAPPTAR